MLGVIAGDIIGSVYESAGLQGKAPKSKEFPLFQPDSRFTDDTVLTVAVADALMAKADYVDAFHSYFFHYPNAGYGGSFIGWAMACSREPYNSWGNGSAMRVAPVAYFFNSLDDVLAEARRCADVTHNHPEGVRGAQATAAAIFLARDGRTKEDIRAYVANQFGYDFSRTLDEIRPGYSFDVSCQGSVPQSLLAFLEATDFEDAIRNAISLGGDTDTMAAIAGGVAEVFFGGVPEAIEREVTARLDDRIRSVVSRFKALTQSDFS
jgi:ADP-ribosylglycohydrolase